MLPNFWNRNQPPVAPADISIPKTITESATVTSRLMEILDSNGHGNVHGGVILRMIDESAAIVAIKHARRSVVTARIDEMNFLAPAYIGEVVTIKARMAYVGRTSMEVEVEVLAESPRRGETRQVGTCNIVYVALDDNRNPVPVPPLKASNEEEEARIHRAKTRRDFLKKMKEELEKLS